MNFLYQPDGQIHYSPLSVSLSVSPSLTLYIYIYIYIYKLWCSESNVVLSELTQKTNQSYLCIMKNEIAFILDESSRTKPRKYNIFRAGISFTISILSRFNTNRFSFVSWVPERSERQMKLKSVFWKSISEKNPGIENVFSCWVAFD